MPTASDILYDLLSAFASELADIVAHPPGSSAKARAWNQADAAQRLAQVERALIALGKRVGLMIGPFLTDAIRTGKRAAYYQAKNAAGQLIEKFGSIPASSSLIVPPSSFAIKPTFSRVDTGALQVLAKETYNDVMKMARTTAARGGFAIRALAQRSVTNGEVNDIISKGILRGQRDEPIRKLGEVLEKIHGKTMTLIDKNGDPRETDTRKYAELVVRTRTREAEEESRHRQIQDFGRDLVVIVGPASPDVCGDLTGHVFSLSGKDKTYPALSSTPGGGPPFHPNCRHSTCLFVPELSTPEQIAASHMSEDARQLLGKSPAEALRIHKDLQLGNENDQRLRDVRRSITGVDPGPSPRKFRPPDTRNPDPHKS